MRELATHFNFLPHVIALAVAYALAIPIGWNREKAERSAGLRTFPLVAVAACAFVQAAERLLLGHPEGTARIIEGVITGIGFIGGGAIVKHGTSVFGTATAASLWATGAIGLAVGLGAYDVAVVVSAFTFLTLLVLSPLKQDDSPPR
jgi:putative Mg2+ transporter-C (MgtC) family protein